MLNNKKAFSLIELAVTVSIIGILSSLSINILNEYKDRVYAMAIVVDLKNIETALRAYMLDTASRTWPFETAIPGGGQDPSINQLVQNANGLGRFMKFAPTPKVGNPKTYHYDNDNWDLDGYNPANCSQRYDGVGLSITGLKASHIRIINKALDRDNNLNCGNLREHVPGGVYYMMSRRYNIL